MHQLNIFAIAGLCLLSITLAGCGSISTGVNSAASSTGTAAENAVATETLAEIISAASGGTLAFSDGTKVILPAGALATDTRISIIKPKNVTELEENFAGYVSVEAGSNSTLQKQASVTFKFDPVKIADTIEASVISYSENNPEVNLVSEKSRFQVITPEAVNTLEGTVTFKTDHFSVFSFFWEDKAYLVFDFPGKYLKKGDLIYVLTNATSSRLNGAWFPGHTGIYLGAANSSAKTNDGTTVIESTPYDPNFGINADGVQTSTLDKFKLLSGQHIFIGARRPKNITLTANQRKQIAEFALDKAARGIGYQVIGGGSFLNISNYTEISCAGLTELAYAAAGISLVPEISEFLLYPIRQFNRTKQVDEINVLAGEKINFRIYGLVRNGLRYSRDSSKYTVVPTTASDIFTSGKATLSPILDAYNFEWTPKQSQIGQSISVDFAMSGSGLTPVTQTLIFNVIGSYFPVVNGAQYQYREIESSSATSETHTYTIAHSISAGTTNEVTEVKETVTSTNPLAENNGFWSYPSSFAGGVKIADFSPYFPILPSDLQEPGVTWESNYAIKYTANVVGGPLTIEVVETAVVAEDYLTQTVTAKTFENVLKITRRAVWTVPEISGTDSEGKPVTVRTDEKIITGTEYYAPGVGLIKSTLIDKETATTISSSGSNTEKVTGTTERELLSYSIPD